MIPGWGRCIKAFLLKGKIYSFLLFSLSRSHSAKQCENMLSIFSHSRSLLELTYIEFILPRNCSVTSVTSSINYAIVPSFCRSAAYLNGYILCYFFSGSFAQNIYGRLNGWNTRCSIPRTQWLYCWTPFLFCAPSENLSRQCLIH